ncbi:phosphate-induced protein 1 [Jimgerdemannia flammicorona]|uniref:Phosphate-induced protein 1 n=1 Tax=Jimgerdemannia flammicorona TaxID=994334 RepID=A0A433QK61_9FUNG|nr:phosphate-induced protein 1 [Jimgerdemannia flammicorona]
MLGTVNVYNIFYGIWPSSSQQCPTFEISTYYPHFHKQIVDDFISRISDSDYWNIEKAYHDGSNRNITGPVVKKDSIVNSFSKGSRLTENNMTQIIEDAFASGMAQDENGIYFILTSEDVTVSGFCNTNKLIKYSFVGVPEKCMSNCSLLNQESSPNGNPPVDAMISVIAHELVEAVSDPLGDAWFDKQGEENADKCIFEYGKTFKGVNGSLYNIELGDRKYLIQQNWNPVTQSCAMTA